MVPEQEQALFRRLETLDGIDGMVIKASKQEIYADWAKKRHKVPYKKVWSSRRVKSGYKLNLLRQDPEAVWYQDINQHLSLIFSLILYLIKMLIFLKSKNDEKDVYLEASCSNTSIDSSESTVWYSSRLVSALLPSVLRV